MSKPIVSGTFCCRVYYAPMNNVEALHERNLCALYLLRLCAYHWNLLLAGRFALGYCVRLLIMSEPFGSEMSRPFGSATFLSRITHVRSTTININSSVETLYARNLCILSCMLPASESFATGAFFVLPTHRARPMSEPFVGLIFFIVDYCMRQPSKPFMNETCVCTDISYCMRSTSDPP